jgi:hypothetical protein
MKVASIDNHIILYMQGNEDIERLQEVLLTNKIKGIPAKDIAYILENEVNVMPTLGKEKNRDQRMLEENARQYKEIIKKFDEAYSKKNKK